MKEVFFVAKATQVFTAICNSVCKSHILCHTQQPITAYHVHGWLFIPSANQNKLKLYTCTV